MLTKTVSHSAQRVPLVLRLTLLALLILGGQRTQAAIAVADSIPPLYFRNTTTIARSFLATNSAKVLVIHLSQRGADADGAITPATLDWVVGGITQKADRVVSTVYNTSQHQGDMIYRLWNPNPGFGFISGATAPNPNGPKHWISAYTLTGVDTNISVITVATNAILTNAPITTEAVTVPSQGFAAITGHSFQLVNNGEFSASPGGSPPVNWRLSDGGSTLNMGYIANLTGGSTTFSYSVPAGDTGKLQLVAAVFTPDVSGVEPPVMIDPTVTPGQTSATLGATVAANGRATIDDYGVVYSATAVNATPKVGGTGVTKLQKGTTETLGAFTVSAPSLTPATQYNYAGYGHNSAGYGYSSYGSFFTVASEPTIQAAGVTFSNAQRTFFTFSWTRGNGENCIVLVKAGSPVDAPPADGTSYTNASANFGNLGDQIGTGNYVVYVGTNTSIRLRGLAVGTTYHVAVYELNGTDMNGTIGTENYLTNSPATGSQTALPNTYYSDAGSTEPTSLTSWWTETAGTGDNPPNFTGGDIFIIQSGHTYADGGVIWTLSGGAQLIINSGGTLDMKANPLFLGGSFVNNGTFLSTGATVPTVNFTASGTLALGGYYSASVVAIGGGGGGAGAALGGIGGGGGGGACAYSAAVPLKAATSYTVTVGAGGARGNAGTFGGAGGSGLASSFSGGTITAISANGGNGGASSTNGLGVGGAGGVAGSSGVTANYAGGSAITGGGAGGGGAGDAGAGGDATSGTGGAGGAGSITAGGAGGSAPPSDTAGNAGNAPGGGGSGGASATFSVRGGEGGAGLVTIGLVAVAPPPLPPVITSTVLSGSNLIISGVNGTGIAGGTYYVLASTNVTVPIASWPRISTNTYGTAGAFSATNQVSPGTPARFYLIEE